MAGCGCKGSKIDDFMGDGTKTKVSIGSYILKLSVFLLMLIALPVIILIIVWFMFRTIVLNKEVNIKPLLTTIGKKFQDKDDDEDDDTSLDDLTEDDVVMVDVEDITNKK